MSKKSLGVLVAVVVCLPSFAFAQSSSRGGGGGGGSSYRRPSRPPAAPARRAVRPSRPATSGSGSRSAPARSTYTPGNATLLQGRSSGYGGTSRSYAPSSSSAQRSPALLSGSSGSSGRATSPGVSSPVSFRDKSLKAREWWDNTHTYNLQARLVEVKPDRVVLVRDDGRQMSVVWRRMSLADQNFVRQQLDSRKKST